MLTEGIVHRIAHRSKQTQVMVEAVQKLLADSRAMIIEKRMAEEIARLKEENEHLVKEAQLWKDKLVELERQNGVRQIEVQGSSSQPTAVFAATSKATEMLKEKKQTPKMEKEKKQETPKMAKEASQKVEKNTDKKAKKPKDKMDSSVQDDERVDVGRLDLRIGRIISAKKHPDADGLYVEEVDVGDERPRTVVSGLVKFVPLEEMQNRIAVLLCNLKPAKMRGVPSEAMVMCASTPDKVEILIPPPDSMPGERIAFEGYASRPDAQLNPKKKIFEQVAPDLKTDANCVATYKGVPFVVPGKGIVKASTLANVQIK